MEAQSHREKRKKETEITTEHISTLTFLPREERGWFNLIPSHVPYLLGNIAGCFIAVSIPSLSFPVVLVSRGHYGSNLFLKYNEEFRYT